VEQIESELRVTRPRDVAPAADADYQPIPRDTSPLETHVPRAAAAVGVELLSPSSLVTAPDKASVKKAPVVKGSVVKVAVVKGGVVKASDFKGSVGRGSVDVKGAGVKASSDVIKASSDVKTASDIRAVSPVPVLPLSDDEDNSPAADAARHDASERGKTDIHWGCSSSSCGVHLAKTPLPVVERVVPPHGPEDGGTVVVVYGRHFMEGRLRVFIGTNPCASTRRLSDTALQCTLPKGHGTHLPVQVTGCDCTDQEHFDTMAVTFADAATSRTSFSYNEAAARQQTKATRSTVLQSSNWHVQLNTDTLSDPYEVRFFDASVEQKIEFALVPALLDLVPSSDSKPKFETCAVVSGGGALAGSRLGPTIDASSAVFRTDNSPSAMKFSTDVGKRTTFQVIGLFFVKMFHNQKLAEEKLKIST
jgi:hypothetical protein